MSTVAATHIWGQDDEEPRAVDHLDLDFGGAIGDRHYGELMPAGARQSDYFPKGTMIRNHRQVSIVDLDELAKIASAMGIAQLPPGIIADNICTNGIPDLTSLPAMTRLVFQGGAVIMTGGENYPCVISGRMIAKHFGTRPEAFPKSAMGLRGVTGWVEHPGVVAPGDAVTVHRP